MNDVSVQQRNIGFVFQNYALFKNMNVFKNIAFGLKIKKWKRTDIKARIAELGDTVFASSRLDFGKLIAADTEKWAKVIHAANIKAE